jgi:hypothetical protein
MRVGSAPTLVSPCNPYGADDDEPPTLRIVKAPALLEETVILENAVLLDERSEPDTLPCAAPLPPSRVRAHMRAQPGRIPGRPPAPRY